MVRKLLVCIAATISVLIPFSAAANGAADVVVAEPAAHGSSLRGGGVLSRSADPSPVGLVAVASGLAVLACTLTGILYRRSAERVPEPITTYGRRTRKAFRTSSEPRLAAGSEGVVTRTILAPGAPAHSHRSEPVHR